MDRLVIGGGNRIEGTVKASGAKNALLPVLAATLLTNRAVTLSNCPDINDVHNMLGILTLLGCECEMTGNSIYVNPKKSDNYVMPESLSHEMRSSIFLLGPVLARHKKAVFVFPGGCDIGARPIDLHLKGLSELNVKIEEKDGKIYCDAKDMRAGEVTLSFPSVGATENIMMVATAANGKVIIKNAAKEPEIKDLACFIRKLGYNIEGEGTDTITIYGRSQIPPLEKDVSHSIIPDRIEAGTILAAAAITHGKVRLENTCPQDMMSIISAFRDMGCDIVIKDDVITLDAENGLKGIDIDTQPHPGFPTDMQPIMTAVCTVCDGTTYVTENLFESRFRYAGELAKMGADITVCGRSATVRKSKLCGACVDACDLRGGAALVVAALAADGSTTIEFADRYIDRGYESIEKTLTALGADIIRIKDR